MHELEPFYGWEKYYVSNADPQSPFFGAEYNFTTFENSVYNHYIHPFWDYIGSETLYIKVLFCDYLKGYTVIEMFGEWNDTLHNDIMHFKRNVIDSMLADGIKRFVLIGENVLNYHGLEDDYYQEWFEEVEDGWIALVNFRDFVLKEMSRYNLDYYLNFGGNLDIDYWRTLPPKIFCQTINQLITKRLGTGT